MVRLKDALSGMREDYESFGPRDAPLTVKFSSICALNHFLRAIEQDLGAPAGELGRVGSTPAMFNGIVFEFERPQRASDAPLKFWAA
jgi:hypothetical protein